jgi:hypothetical protein
VKDTAEAVLRELYRLYLWRFEIGAEETAIKDAEAHHALAIQRAGADPQVVGQAFVQRVDGPHMITFTDYLIELF